ncbi:MAG: hypothetical protein V3W52_01035, partial [Syntrophobacteria bacterium]
LRPKMSKRSYLLATDDTDFTLRHLRSSTLSALSSLDLTVHLGTPPCPAKVKTKAEAFRRRRLFTPRP